MTKFWAKTNLEGKPGISVFQHMLNVGYVAKSIAKISPMLLKRFLLHPSAVGALAALHDLGKISPGFQSKCDVWIEENNLTDIVRLNEWKKKMESDHGKVSHAAIQDFLSHKTGVHRKTAKFVSAVLGGHHGRLNRPNDRGFQPEKATTENRSGINWHKQRMKEAEMIWEHFCVENEACSFKNNSPSLWWLAGLASVADWIGSDERFFPPDFMKQKTDLEDKVVNALTAIGLGAVNIMSGLSFHDLFHTKNRPEQIWVPNDVQQKAYSFIKGSGVYVIEAPMGMGKTEAALWVSYKLLVAGDAIGIYFALPTQTTSNRMHLRINDFLSRICPQSPNSRLIHSNSWLLAKDMEIKPAATKTNFSISEDARTGRDWFASAKRALIAPFGVGTIDQALLGIVASKHFFVRHFALAGKVVILDEVHSYDIYTGTLIDKLVATLEYLGCTVIILSATLTGKRREQIVNFPRTSKKDEIPSYPLLSGRSESKTLLPVRPVPPQDRTIKIKFVSNDYAFQKAARIAKQGGAVLWICDTIGAAQNQYRRFSAELDAQFPLGLLHARFPFWRREQLETEWMERLGKDGRTHCGCILVATQVVEQSVDLDADLLVTELAPTDMLLQRLGRLWRHERKKRPADSATVYILKEEKNIEDFQNMQADEINETLGSKAKVYAPYVLLRTYELWSRQSAATGEITIPLQIRDLIEATYRRKEDEPESWRQLNDDWFAANSTKKILAGRNSKLWQVALEDVEGVQTRLNEMPTVALILCRSISENKAIFIDDSVIRLEADRFQFPLAQAIHKNLVRTPEYCFEYIAPCAELSQYVKAEFALGFVTENGNVEIKGKLKDGIRLFYSDELGLVIENDF
jgi:CRISPR-associated endonuclease/helicase Cas3